jgi:hypothetical protein
MSHAVKRRAQPGRNAFDTLPTDVASHLTSMLTMRDFLHLRGASSNLYERVEFRGVPMACLTRLRPSLIQRLIQERDNRLRYLGLRLTFPPTAEEVAALHELRGARGLDTVELRFDFKIDELNNMSNDVLQARTRAALDVLPVAFALQLRSLTLVSEYTDGKGDEEMEQLTAACILANRTTLQHLSMPHDTQLTSVLDHASIRDVLLGLESLRVAHTIAGVTNTVDIRLYTNPPPCDIPCVSTRLPKWRYLSVLLESTRSFFIEPVGSALVPACLPDTLEGLALVSTANIRWTCPPCLAFLHVLTDSCACVLYSSVPPAHTQLTCLVIGIYPSFAQYDEPQHEQAFATWLNQASLPALETVSIYGNLSMDDLMEVARLMARLPHVKHLYLDLATDLSEDEREDDPEKLRLCVQMLKAGLPPGIRFDLDARTPDLEAQFLIERQLSILSPCTRSDIIVERGEAENADNANQDDDDDDGSEEHLLHLQPLSVFQGDKHQRRRLG